MEVAFSMLFIAAYARFTQSFLNLKEQYPHINNWVNFGYKIMLMYVIIDFLIILTIGKSVFFELFAKFSLVIPGVYAFYQMYKAKKLIFDFIWLGSLMIILGAALTVIIIQLKINGFYDSSLDLSGRKFFFYMLSGSLLEILFFTSAIGYQGLLNEKEKNETQQKLFDQLNENNSLRIRQLESDVKTLKSQINPHFIFNSLNAIKLLIQENKNPKANQYLIQFSELLRIVMEQATLPKITLEEELETSQVYLELESLRFDKSFQFEIIQDEGIDLSFIDVPPLIFQPFLENAIWHGLLHKQGERKLSINILKNGDFVFCEIEDNGIGRAKSKALAYQYGKLKKSSIGIKNTKERISIFQKLYKTNLELEIIDLIDQRDIPQGTKIVFKILI
jgi:sensor histidine kinase YesM